MRESFAPLSMFQVGDAGGDKVPWAQNRIHAALVQELH